jgi:polyhydroxyalkanoate synthase
VPWESSFRAVHLFKGEVTFILGSSGHVAGVINPPAKKKGSYWKAKGSTGSAAEWQKSATENPGSWWADWQKWVGAQSDAEVAARKQAKSLAPAPGTYVAEK